MENPFIRISATDEDHKIIACAEGPFPIKKKT